MLRIIGIYGAIAGLIVATPMVFLMLAWDEGEAFPGNVTTGYLTMLVALTAVFLGVKQYRDKVRGGVVKFLPAFGVGLAISALAGVIYVVGWELSLALSGIDFMERTVTVEVERLTAEAAAQAEIDRFKADMAWMLENYTNPLIRMPMTFAEMFPLGILVSLVSAGLLRNERFLRARS